MNNEQILKLAHEHGLVHGLRIGVDVKSPDIVSFAHALLASDRSSEAPAGYALRNPDGSVATFKKDLTDATLIRDTYAKDCTIEPVFFGTPLDRSSHVAPAANWTMLDAQLDIVLHDYSDGDLTDGQARNAIKELFSTLAPDHPSSVTGEKE